MRHTSRINAVADRAQDLYTASRKIARKGTTQANSFIHENPVLSTLLGVGAGFVVSLIFRSRD